MSYSNNTVYFDFVGMIHKKIDYNIDTAKDSVKTAGRDYINVNEKFIKSPTRYFTYLKDIGVNPNGTGNEQLDTWKNDNTKTEF